MVSIRKHKSYPLSLPKFLCDFKIKDKDNVPVPFNLFVEGFRFIVFCARPGLGKTSLLVSCLTDSKIFKKTYNHVMVCMPASSRNSLKKNPFKDLPDGQLFDDLDELGKIHKMLEDFSNAGESSLLLIDDMQAYLKRPDVSQALNAIIANRRHLKVTIVTCLQTFNMLPLKTRKLINILVCWKPQRKEWKSITEELLDEPDHVCNEIYEYAFKKDNADGHKWLLIDTTSGSIFSMFDELITR